MGCGCNKGTTAMSMPKGFVHTAADGKTTTLRSEIEARAMVLRKGGTYKPVK
jgi:hypothetical protein